MNNTTMKRALIKFREARENCAMAFEECLGVKRIRLPIADRSVN